MSDKNDKKHTIQELKEMIKERKPNESVEEVLSVFCQRHGMSIDTCQTYYKQLIKKGRIKENKI